MTKAVRIDLRISGQHEEPHPLNEKEAKTSLFQLDEASLEVSNKSRMINRLTKKHSLTNAAKVDQYLVSHRDSETDALQNVILERHEVS